MAQQPTGHTSDALRSLDIALDAIAVAAATLDALLPRLDDAQRRDVVARVGDIGRGGDALKVRVADDLAKRHDGLPKDERFPLCCGYKDPLEMLAAELGASRRTARQLLRVASATRASIGITGATVPARFPILGGALETGAISLEAVGAVLDALGDAPDRAHADDVAAAEEALVASAIGDRGTHRDDTGTDAPMPPELLARLARMWRDAMDPDGAEPRYERQLAERGFTFGTRPDGMVQGRLICTPDQGAVLAAAFDAFTGPRTKPRFQSDDERAAAALEVDDRSRPQQMVDALIAMVGRSVEQRDVPRVGGEAPVVVVHVAKQSLEAAATGTPGCTATVERTGDCIPVHLAASMLCDGRIQSAVTGADGLPLHLGRADRLFSRAQRRALAIRDGGCRAPGCTFPVGWTEAHHIVPWEEGGPTDLDNGILLCSHHHHEVHRGTLEVQWASGSWVVVPRTRRAMRIRGFGRRITGAAPQLQPTA
ncbi:HNH endonuclease signature motif containing protein [Agrococcus sp. SCSIO52902]|uniref:HNH endonuclease signature motif containing protein n=1 Tax=Agrococcus sp. SCSIO52902 TaxID=2933290 RepID=UPI001FF2D868|nr:HNH endonuclease signature motif containing protein [Agrococcus sp. SCSIO52902]UOV99855.1 HNH endonuclease [Agrococcus sp. SCSIO52902]